MQSWRLPEIDTPGGTLSPVVLTSADDARAVLIELQPGQELGDHQVKENAWLVVIDGAVTITKGGDVLEAPGGTLVRFPPGERHAVSSRDGGRILLLLAPWPGEGHYLDDAPDR